MSMRIDLFWLLIALTVALIAWPVISYLVRPSAPASAAPAEVAPIEVRWRELVLLNGRNARVATVEMDDGTRCVVATTSSGVGVSCDWREKP